MAKEVSLEDLTPLQKEVALHAGGPVLALAGAGSGKTLILTCRYSNLVKKRKTPPSSIFTVTFSKRAAEEMKSRIERLTGCEHKNNWIGTFHSHCNRILRKDIGAIGFKPNFILLDEDDQNALIRNILKEFNIYEALYKGVSARISMLKASLISPEDFLSQGDGFGFDEKLGRVYLRYQDELKRCNSLDHDDLILTTVRLFEECPEILEKYTTMFSELLVDEFQDTTKAQYRLLQMLAGKKKNICAVGDDAQSIYRFRGADVGNIRNFAKDFPGAKIIKITQNFRSSQNILKVCGSVIAAQKNSKPKFLKSDEPCGEKVFYRLLNNEDEEAKYVARTIKDLYLKSNYDYDKFAIFYRVNLQSRALEDALREENIPYHISGNQSFYQKKEIKDIISYMRLALNNNDNVSLRRIINSPARGIGATTINKIEQEARKNSASLFKTMKALLQSNGIAPTFKDKLAAFARTIDRISSHNYKCAPDMIKDIIEKTGYLDDIEEEKAENVLEFLASADNLPPLEFLDRISLPCANETKIVEKSVALLPLHNAKGLEYDVVFIIGLEEGILPYFKAFDNAAEMQEERRLFYVGMTRACKALYLSSAKKRRLYSKIQEHEPSRFLADIPRDCCTWIEKTANKEKRTPEKIAPTNHKKTAPFIIGARVKHPSWGEGIVRDCSGDGDDTKVTVNFPGIGVKRLAAKLANLERI